jgi:hypothetical protein
MPGPRLLAAATLVLTACGADPLAPSPNPFNPCQ